MVITIDIGQSRINTATSDTLSLKLQSQFTKNKYYRKPVLPAHSFAIQHYAGEVIYDTNLGFLERNKDFIIPEFMAVLKKSTIPFIHDLFGESQPEPEVETKARRRQSVNLSKTKASSFKFASVVSQFKESLNTLLHVIEKTNPHYIKCIRPNEWNSPRNFQNLMVLHQLKCSGIIDAVHINLEVVILLHHANSPSRDFLIECLFTNSPTDIISWERRPWIKGKRTAKSFPSSLKEFCTMPTFMIRDTKLGEPKYF